jgi:hypothetical protein
VGEKGKENSAVVVPPRWALRDVVQRGVGDVKRELR